MENTQGRIKTFDEVRADLERKGISVSRWAKEHGVSPDVVHAVLNGRRGMRIGEGHKVGVLLGLKRGEIVDDTHGALAGGRRSHGSRRAA